MHLIRYIRDAKLAKGWGWGRPDPKNGKEAMRAWTLDAIVHGRGKIS